jgi:flavin-dependent dehydrogenase
MAEPLDAIILGAGPAGLAAGIAMASGGLRVTVVERGELPQDKACGEGLMPTAVAALTELGVCSHFSANHTAPFHGIHYVAPSGAAAVSTFAEGPGLGIRRTVLSQAMLDRAREIEGLDIVEKTRALPVRREADAMVVRVGEDLVRTRLIVGADGLRSKTRDWAGLTQSGCFAVRCGARRHFRKTVQHCPAVEVYWSDGMEAYVTPISSQEIGIALLWDRDHPEQGRGIPFAERLQQFPALAPRLAGATPTSSVRGVPQLEQRCRSAVAPGVILLGDAAGFLDALTGEGVNLALAEGLALRTTVIPLLKEGRGVPSLQGLQPYQKAVVRIQKPYYQVTRAALWISRQPRRAELFVRVLASRPRFFQHVLSANMGTVPLWRLSPAEALASLLELGRASLGRSPRHGPVITPAP